MVIEGAYEVPRRQKTCLFEEYDPLRVHPSMTSVCAGCRRWHPILEGGDQLHHE